MSYSEEQSGSQALSVSEQRVKHGSKNVKSRKRKRDGTCTDRNTEELSLTDKG